MGEDFVRKLPYTCDKNIGTELGGTDPYVVGSTSCVSGADYKYTLSELKCFGTVSLSLVKLSEGGLSLSHIVLKMIRVRQNFLISAT